MQVQRSSSFRIQVFQGETQPLKEHILKVGEQNKEGLLTRILLEQRAYLDQLKNQKNPLQQYIESYSKRVLFARQQATPLQRLNKSRGIDLKA